MKFLVLLCGLLALVSADRASDQLFSVPRYSGTIGFNQYSGYINVAPGRDLYYWFAESQSDPKNDPVTLWLNGGPGCSSLDGLFYEHGPWHFDSDIAPASVVPNPYSWNINSNLIYLEAPAGVGYSETDNYHTNDTQTAQDNYQFLLGFFKQFPEFKPNDFYISGESYAGIYVPTLAYAVHHGNLDGNEPINMKGYIVGNGVTNEEYDSNSFMPFAGMHGLYSPSIFFEMQQGGCFMNSSIKCTKLKTQAYKEMGNVNIYGIYNPCYDGPNSVGKVKFAAAGLSGLLDENGEEVVPPCINVNALTEYLNDESVRQGIHARSKKEVGDWEICSGEVKYKKLYQNVESIYEELAPLYRILIYSGDTDGAVPYVGTVGWIKDFEGKTVPKIEWVHWVVDDQVAGYTTIYPDLSFVTIKGAGHMVPQDKPPIALTMFNQFISNSFPTNT